MKRYEGRIFNGEPFVSVNGKGLALRLDLANKSPTGFAWGYLGSGPSQLALAMLADCLGDEVALRHYQTFKDRVIGGLPESWILTAEDIAVAIESCERDARGGRC